MRVISVINLKGGVGKTTTSANLAYDLAEYHGCKVLVIDNDKQGNISRLFKAYDEDEDCGMYKVLLEDKLTDIIKYTDYTNIDIITANMTLLSANLMLMQEDTEEQHTRLRNYLSQLENLDNETYREYDYVIIDNPPTIDMCVINALACTDDVIVPVKVDKWALEGLDIITSQIKEAKEFNPCLNILGVLITAFKKNDINEAGEEWIRKKSGYPVFETKIRRTEKADEATFFEKPVGEYSTRSAAARDYKALTLEYLRLTEE
ncbi:ParA family protein [Cellulosilyticum lentocellum]|uniref:Cobyrinic acid ac-diamide synthase n=1 Tax=Cellulosilyticum lentocellum (strain ATCC 49066 / DSM 5427 / NCIMB 11756 / RHM5) TaxID=642492 RepID=F2JNW4_CELLD|nr:ParA family protein [Cellulosilyticum lentocellum]ADZ82462.1 Cobyrinic acid ac-diamide synthase [Cellulosilyticum lentocellum DSM 5427]